MANIDLNQLQNIEPLNLSIQGVNSSANALAALQNAPDTTGVGNFWFLGGILLLFLMLNFIFYRQEQNIQLDITRSILTSSGWCFFISAGFLLGGIVSTILPVMWFGTLTLVAWIGVQSLKERGG